jgi:hypothetical protein
VKRELHRRVDASVEASRPRDFAVRFHRSSSKSAKASTASRPTFVTMADAPHSGETREAMGVICPTSQAKGLRHNGTTGKSRWLPKELSRLSLFEQPPSSCLTALLALSARLSQTA